MRFSFGVIRLVLVVGVCVFMLAVCHSFFSPLTGYKMGWQPLPDLSESPQQSDVLIPEWNEQAHTAAAAASSGRADLLAPSISVAVSVNGETVWRFVEGFANIEQQRPVSFEHAYRIGSTSKAVTAVAIGKLLDEGLVAFDRPVGDLGIDLPKSYQSITLGQAMSHRGGVRNYGTCFCFPIWEFYSKRAYDSSIDALSAFTDSDLLFAPGERYSYTSFGFNLAGAVAEDVTGLHTFSILDSRVFSPLNMDHSGLDSFELSSVRSAGGDRSGIPRSSINTVDFYLVENNQYKSAFPVNNSIKWVSGGLLSTPSDLVKVGEVMFDHSTFLSNETRRALLAIPEEGREKGGEYYALGWRNVPREVEPEMWARAYHHNGTAVGSTSSFIVFPDEQVVVSVLVNRSLERSESVGGIANNIAAPFIKKRRDDQVPPVQ